MDKRSGLVTRVVLGAFVLFICFFWMTQITAQLAPHTRKKVRFWHMWTAEWKDVVDKIVDRYNKSQTEYEVEALSVPNPGADSKFILGVMGGDPPDVMAQWSPIIPPWADDHLLRPLDDLMSPEEKQIFDAQAYPVVKKLGTYKGKLYGMSIGINMFAIYYLPQHFKDAGMNPDRMPSTLEELSAAGKKLNRFDSSGNLTRLGWGPSNIKMFAPIFGGGFFDWNNAELTIDSKQNVAALDYMSKIRSDLGFDNVVRFTSGLDMNSSSGGWPFIEGAYSMTMDGQ